MSEFQLRKNPETGKVYLWEQGSNDWREVQARKNEGTGEVFVYGEGDAEWRNLGAYAGQEQQTPAASSGPLEDTGGFGPEADLTGGIRVPGPARTAPQRPEMQMPQMGPAAASDNPAAPQAPPPGIAPQAPIPASAPAQMATIASLMAPPAAGTAPQAGGPDMSVPAPTGGAQGLGEMAAAGAGVVPFRPNGPVPVSPPVQAAPPSTADPVADLQRILTGFTDDARAQRGLGRSALRSDGTEPQLGTQQPTFGQIADTMTPTAEPDPFAGESFGELAKRRGQQVAQGATEVAAGVPESIAITGAITDATRADEARRVQRERAETIQGIQERLKNPDLEPAQRAIMERTLADLMIGQEELQKRGDAEIIPPDQRPVFSQGDRLRDASGEFFGKPDKRDTGFWAQVAQGAGNMAGLASTAVLGPAGLPAGAALGAGMNMSQIYKEAKAAGASEEDAQVAARWGSVIGASEIIPINRALKLLPPRLREKVGKGFYKRLSDIAQGSGEEAAQEYLATVANNIVARNIYDPERGWTEGATEAALVGAVLGGGMGAVGTALDRGGKPEAQERAPGQPTAPQVPPQPTEPRRGASEINQQASAPERPAAPAPDQAPEEAETPSEQPAPAQTETRPAQGGRVEIVDEVETVDGETRSTGRKVAIDLDTGEVSLVPDESPPSPETDAAQGQPSEDQSVVGADADPAAGGEADQSNDGKPRPKRVFLSHDETLQIGTDADTFQYKGGGDTEGVTDRLQGVEKFDPIRAGQVIVYERADGSRIIADGHQRTGLARRMANKGQADVGGMAAVIYREVDGYTPDEVMVEAALKNISEGSGTATDAARILRGTNQTARELGLPTTSALVRDAEGIRNLSDDAFGMVANGVSTEQHAGIVGRVAKDPALHADILKLLGRMKPANAAQAEMIARDAAADSTEATQDSLFGSETTRQTLYKERAQVLDGTIKSLKRDKALFNTLVSQGNTIESAGNQLDSDANSQRLADDAMVLQYLQSQANKKGPISDALTAAAQAVADGQTPAQARKGFVEAVRRATESGGTEGAGKPQGGRDPEGDGESLPGTGQSLAPEPQGLTTETTPEGEQGVLPGGEASTDQAAAAKRDRDSAEIEARSSQSKARSGVPQGDAGPLFDTQGDMFDAPRATPDENAPPKETGADLIAKGQDVLEPYAGDDDPKPRHYVDLTDQEKGRDLADRLAAVDGLEARAEVADAWVLEVGKRSGVEHLVALDAEGLPLVIAMGRKNAVDIPDSLTRAAMDGKVAHLTHNHPAGRSFSVSDLRMMSMGYEPVVAMGHNGTRHEARMSDAARGKIDHGVMRTAYTAMERKLKPLIQKAYEAKADSSEETLAAFNGAFHSILTLALDRMGVIEYNGDAQSDLDAAGVSLNDFYEAIEKGAAPSLGRAGFDVAAQRDRGSNSGTGRRAGNARDQGGNGVPAQSAPDRDTGGRAETDREVTGDDDFDGALDDIFGKDENTPTPGKIDVGPPPARRDKAKPARSKSDIAKDLGNLFNEDQGAAIGRTDTAAFRRWFGNSKVVDAKGEPLVVYHGTRAETFEAFDGDVFFFGDAETADDYAVEAFSTGEPRVIAAHLSLQNPASEADVFRLAGVENDGESLAFEYLDADVIDALKGEGFDGVVLENDASPSRPGDVVNSWAVFRPEQIKSVDNRGTYDPADPNMLREPTATLDGDKYAQAVPLFREALDGVDVDALSRREVFAAMIRPLADAGLPREAVAKMKPYFDKFLEDVENGALDLDGGSDAPSTGTDLERDRGDAGSSDDMGGSDVSPAGGSTGTGADQGTGTSGGRGGRSADRSGVPAGDAADLGGTGNQGVSGGDRSEPGAADDRDGAGSRADRESGLPDDRAPDQETTRHATDAPDLSDRRKAQAEADGRKVRFNDERNIEATLPLLLPEQRDDVLLIERRFAKPDGHGMLITNGTGTGKTYSGGGVIKAHGGYYSKFSRNGAIPGFQFKTEADRQAFLDDMAKPVATFEEPDGAALQPTLTMGQRPDNPGARTNAEKPYAIWNKRDKRIVGYAATKKGGRNSVDRRDMQHGSYVHRLIDNPSYTLVSKDQAAYHGTPHDFDAFSLDAVGTGNGGQARGWGLYFADRAEMAQSYRDEEFSANPHLLIDGRKVSAGKKRMADRNAQERAVILAAGALEDGQSLFAAVMRARNALRAAQSADLTTFQKEGGWGDADVLQETVSILEDWDGRDVQLGKGRLFSVDVPEDSDLLDFDAPMKEQPAKIREALEGIAADDPVMSVWLTNGTWGEITGATVYGQLSGGWTMRAFEAEGPKKASLALRAAGIPGHRSKATGSQVFVIYDESAVRVVAKERAAQDLNTSLMDPVIARQVMPSLRAALDRMNLKRVNLGLDKSGKPRQGAFEVNGLGQMDILIGLATDPTRTLYHEAIHALRAMNLFTSEEWTALEQAAAKGWVEKHDIAERYPHLMPSEQIEEAIAEEFAERAASRKAPKGPLLVRAFNKIARVLKAIREAFAGKGYPTPESVFGDVLAGRIGARDAGNTGLREAMEKDMALAPRRGPQAQAHGRTAMGKMPMHIPDRSVWDELTRNNRGIWARLKGGSTALNDQIDKARIKIQDRFLPVLRAQQVVARTSGAPISEDHNAYAKETTFSGKVGRHLFEIDEEYTKPIIDLIAETRGALDADEVGTFLYARHAKERNARIASINPNMPDGGSGMTDAEADTIMTQLQAGPHWQRLQKIGALIDGLRERTLALREDAGLITPAEATLWRNQYKYYVPLKGFADTDHSEAMLDVTGVGRRFNTRGPESKRALGRQSEAFNPLQAALTQAQEVSIRAEKNRVGQALYRLAKDHPSKAMWSVKKPKQVRYFNRTTGMVETRTEDPRSLFMDPNELAVKVAGEEQRIIFHDERLAQAAGSVGADQMGWFISIMSKASRWFSAVNTMLDPEFVIRNAFRDMTAAQINIRNFGADDRNALAKAMVRSWPKAWAAAMRGQKRTGIKSEWDRWWTEFEEAGGKVSFWRLEQPEAGKSDMEKRIKLAGGNLAQRASRFVRISTRDNPILGFIERTNLAVDNAVRLAAYVEARKKGWSKQEAAQLSKNLTVNFNRRGEWGATINALYPFANASIQGTQILIRAMTSKRMAKYALGMVGLGILLDQVNAHLSEEDEDGELAYDKIPDWKNSMNLTVMLGPESGHAATVWLPYGYSLFPYMGQQTSKILRGVKEPGAAMADFAAAAFGAFSPMGGRDLQSTITPTMLDPINEMAMNEDWLGRPIRPESPYDDYGPDAYKYYRGVTTASRVAADALNKATGGNIAEAGAIDVSPEYIDHFFGFVTGGAGRFTGRTIDTMGKLLRGEADQVEERNIPFYRSLQTDTGDWLDGNRYYTFREELREGLESADLYEEAGRPMPEHIRRARRLEPALKEAEKLLRAQRKALRTLDDADGLPSDAKAERRERIRKAQNRVQLMFNKRYIQVMGPQGE